MRLALRRRFQVAPSAAPCGRAAAGRAGPRRSANSRSKAKKIRSSVLPSESAACRAGEVRRAVLVQRAGLAVDDGSPAGPWPSAADVAELVGPVEALAGPQRRLAALDAQLQPIAVELDLVAPAGARRRPLDRLGQLRRRRSPAGRRPSSARPCCGRGLRRDLGRGRRRRSGRSCDCQTALAAAPPLPVMNGLGPLPLPAAISSIVRPEATEVGSSSSQRVAVALHARSRRGA